MNKKFGRIILIVAVMIFLGEVIFLDILDMDLGVFNSILNRGVYIMIFASLFVAFSTERKQAENNNDSKK